MWQVAAGSLTGPHHTSRGEANQDAYATLISDDGSVALLAVADGAGSLPRSGEGATRAVTAALAAASAHLAAVAPAVCDAATLDIALRSGVAAAVADLTGDPDAASLGATLALAAVSPAAWAAAVVGDSFAVITAAGGAHRLVRPAPAGEFANITRLLTSRDPQPLHASADEPLTAVAVSSDGLQWATLGPDGPHAGFYTPLAGRTAAGQLNVDALLTHMHRAGKIDDDSTLAVAARRVV